MVSLPMLRFLPNNLATLMRGDERRGKWGGDRRV